MGRREYIERVHNHQWKYAWDKNKPSEERGKYAGNQLGKSISTTDPQIVADNTYVVYVWGSPAASAGQIIPNPHTITPP
jgi:hypothetical protein